MKENFLGNIAVRCSHLSKQYPLYGNEREKFKSLFLRKYEPKQFDALSDVNIELKKGEVVGLIGLNGSGKSTLSSIISGITYPTTGHADVFGNVNMLAANAGLMGALTGIENIEYKCLLLGFNKKQIKELEKEIIDFADIGIYMNQPLKTYSSGMKSRLGFAISVSINPDILIIDEALSVGDTSFTDKCINKIDEFRNNGKTIIFVSHSVKQMENFCNSVIWLHRGKIVATEKPEKIISPYIRFAREFNAKLPTEKSKCIPVLSDYQ